MILIGVLLLLLFTWFILAMKNYIQKRRHRTMYEGMANPDPTQYTPPPSSVTSDPLYLTTLNASNISFLKGKVDEVLTLKQQVNDINSQVATITTTVNGLSQQLSTNVKSSTNCDPTNPSACPLNAIAANAAK